MKPGPACPSGSQMPDMPQADSNAAMKAYMCVWCMCMYVYVCAHMCAYTEHFTQKLVFWDIMGDLSSQKTSLQFLPCMQPD